LQTKKPAYRYAVIAFTGDDRVDETVEAVPDSWLTPGKTHCYWPPYTQPGRVRKAITSETLPMPEWRKYGARCLKKCSKYNTVCVHIVFL